MKPSFFSEIILPDNYLALDFLAFHQRDEKCVSEIVQQDQVKKGIIWHGNPALLTISVEKKRAQVQLDIDGDSSFYSKDALSILATHMLGLLQPVEIFEEQYQENPEIGELITRQAGLRIYQSASPFEALSWAIIGQQI